MAMNGIILKPFPHCHHPSMPHFGTAKWCSARTVHVLGEGHGGHFWVQKGFKIIFSKFVPRPLGVLKQMFLARFEPMVARSDPPKFPKSLENGL